MKSRETIEANEPESQRANSPLAIPAMAERIWQPGQSGNPSGRPRKPITDRLLERLAAEDNTLADMVEAMLKAAKSGDVAAFNSIRDTVEGKPKQRIEHTGEDGAPIDACIKIEFVKPDNG